MPNIVNPSLVKDYLDVNSKIIDVLNWNALQELHDEYLAKIQNLQYSNMSVGMIYNGDLDDEGSTINLLETPDDMLSYVGKNNKRQILENELDKIRIQLNAALQKISSLSIDRASLIQLETEEGRKFTELLNQLPIDLQPKMKTLYNRRARAQISTVISGLLNLNEKNKAEFIHTLNKTIASVYDPLLQRGDKAFGRTATLYDPLSKIIDNMPQPVLHKPVDNLSKQEAGILQPEPDIVVNKPSSTAQNIKAGADSLMDRATRFAKLMFHPITRVTSDIRSKKWLSAAFYLSVGLLSAAAGFALVLIVAPALFGVALIGAIAGAYVGISATDIVRQELTEAEVSSFQKIEVTNTASTIAPSIEIAKLRVVELSEPEIVKLNALNENFADNLLQYFSARRKSLEQVTISDSKYQLQVEVFNNNWDRIKDGIKTLSGPAHMFDETQLYKALHSILKAEYASAEEVLVQEKQYKERTRTKMVFNKPETPEESMNDKRDDLKNLIELEEMVHDISNDTRNIL